ncbi:GNAT family N-acetyltransferase [Acinetobacter sp. WCHAc010052]|uniref:GNAT family N-acetyltransferase n=1 Tax=Acinetobacter sp. WCHAc010052 TaxID=2004647 RepID=UPI000B3CDD68|nr:GNAT family N-acetyltransferase [Acinetobacter sp. WCHAc010052]AXY61065.1 GNAT family N-acetyltransferase [Acinetobacter sp. WCHAc010052]
MAITIQDAEFDEAQQILELQKIAYQREAELYQDWNIPPLLQTLHQLELEFENHKILVAKLNDEIVGSVRGYADQGTLHIGRLIVHPDFQKRGIGSQLLMKIEQESKCQRYELFTGQKSIQNIKLYEKLGYQKFKTEKIHDELDFIYLHKQV